MLRRSRRSPWKRKQAFRFFLCRFRLFLVCLFASIALQLPDSFKIVVHSGSIETTLKVQPHHKPFRRFLRKTHWLFRDANLVAITSEIFREPPFFLRHNSLTAPHEEQPSRTATLSYRPGAEGS